MYRRAPARIVRRTFGLLSAPDRRGLSRSVHARIAIRLARIVHDCQRSSIHSPIIEDRRPESENVLQRNLHNPRVTGLTCCGRAGYRGLRDLAEQRAGHQSAVGGYRAIHHVRQVERFSPEFQILPAHESGTFGKAPRLPPSGRPGPRMEFFADISQLTREVGGSGRNDGRAEAESGSYRPRYKFTTIIVPIAIRG